MRALEVVNITKAVEEHSMCCSYKTYIIGIIFVRPTLPPPHNLSPTSYLDHGGFYFDGRENAPLFGAPSPPSSILPDFTADQAEASSYTSYSTVPLPPNPLVTDKKTPKKFSCINRIDGYYFTKPCSKLFYICNNGIFY